MKTGFYKSILLLFFATITTCINAQILRADELETYAKEKYGDSWKEAAEKLSSELTLDKNNALTYTQIIEVEGITKEQLYVTLNHWYSTTFGSGEETIELNDKELGVIIAKAYIEGIAHHTGGANRYIVNLTPIIKTDIKDGKIRITYTVPFYSVTKMAGGGFVAQMGGNTAVKHMNENWVLDKCYPFAKKDSHKKTSCKAFVMAHAYSNVIMDKIEEIVKNGLIGNENDNW